MKETSAVTLPTGKASSRKQLGGGVLIWICIRYGFKHVTIPADLLVTYPQLWPFSDPNNYTSFAKPLTGAKWGQLLSPRDLSQAADLKQLVKFDAIMVFNDPRDWALDTQIILDLLLSQEGYLGSLSPKNGDLVLTNRGYQQDGQPPIYFSNPDLFWAAAYHLPRLGQGGFREALEGVWTAVTGGEAAQVTLEKRMFGKPFQPTYAYAQKMLEKCHESLSSQQTSDGGPLVNRSLQHVYMVGDNPESDILGANQFNSNSKTHWQSVLVQTGVYSSGQPSHRPKAIVEDVWDAVQWAVKHAEAEAVSSS